jgi:hypothetical protein
VGEALDRVGALHRQPRKTEKALAQGVRRTRIGRVATAELNAATVTPPYRCHGYFIRVIGCPVFSPFNECAAGLSAGFPACLIQRFHQGPDK